MLSPQWLTAPIAFVAGLVYHRTTAATAKELLSVCDNDLLRRAGRLSQRDESISRISKELMTLAIEGSRQLESSYITASDVETLEHFGDIYTCRGRVPGDDRMLQEAIN